MNNKNIIFVVGPTAVGKSAAALCLAKKLRGEIISCDSMQIYKEITIASNKPTKEEQNQVQHHLVDILSISQEFDVAQFNHLACKAVDDILSRNQVPIIVGGSGMYMQILLDGIFQGGVKNDALRKDLKEQAKQYGNEYLHDKLKTFDSVAAGKIHPNDLRRVIRALEIYLTEQIPISEKQKKRKGLWGQYDIVLFALDRPRQELYDRINTRVDQMFEQGLINEIQKLRNDQWSQTAEKIIGVGEVKSYLDNQVSLDDAKEQMKLNTRHLAKRQLTWFRREKRLDWIMVESNDTAQTVADCMESELRAESQVSQA